MLRLLYNAHSLSGDSTEKYKSILQSKETTKSIAIELMDYLQQTDNLQLQIIILTFVIEFVADDINYTYSNLDHRFLIFQGDPLTAQTTLNSVLKLRMGNTLDWLVNKDVYCQLLKNMVSAEWETRGEKGLI